MRKLRIVFMGTPEFAVEALESIVETGYEVAGVITAPDKPAGRGRRVQKSAVKQYAVGKGIQVLQPTNLKAPEFISELQELKANLQVVVAFRMLPRMVWDMPEYGTFNLHASLLPAYRGAAPINWAIINGEKESGVTTFFLDEKIDTGEIILQDKISISSSENAGALHDKLKNSGADLVVKTLQLIEKGPVETVVQTSLSTFPSAPKLTKENTRIEWSRSLEEIFNFIRGLSPFPTAWTSLDNGNKSERLKIFAADKEPAHHQYDLGQVIQSEKQVKVAVSGGFLKLKEIQLPGKRKMQVKELLNGYRFFPNAKMS